MGCRRCYYPDVSYYSPDYCKTIGSPTITYQSPWGAGVTVGSKKYVCGANWGHQTAWFNASNPSGPIFEQWNMDAHNWTTGQILSHAPSTLPPGSNYALKSVALIGTLVGQLTFGYLADWFGRKYVHMATMIIMIFAALGQGMHNIINPCLSFFKGQGRAFFGLLP